MMDMVQLEKMRLEVIGSRERVRQKDDQIGWSGRADWLGGEEFTESSLGVVLHGVVG